jgi:S1-C subfamily serine protease
MAIGPMSAFATLSEAITSLVASAAPMLAAIRTGPNRHITGIIWQPDTVITSDQDLPEQESFTVALPGGILTAARLTRRNAVDNLASLRLEGSANAPPIAQPVEPRPGALALTIAADTDAAPLVRLAVIRKVVSGRAERTDRTVVLDMPAGQVAAGAAVLDAAGCLLGMAIAGAGDDATVIPYSALVRMLDSSLAHSIDRSGWLGVTLQPVTVPEPMRSAVGQASGRMIVGVARGGPAELAGLRPGDILLSLDGHSVSGAHALRALLGAEWVGRQVEVRYMRAGQAETRQLTVAPQPIE